MSRTNAPVQMIPGCVTTSVKLRVPATSSILSLMAVTLKSGSNGSWCSTRRGKSNLYGVRNFGSEVRRCKERDVENIAHRREGVDRIPIAVPVIHNDRGRCDARNAEFLGNVCSQRMEAGSAICTSNVQMLFGARDLEGEEGRGERRRGISTRARAVPLHSPCG